MSKYFIGLLTGFFLVLSGFSYRDAQSYYQEGLQSLQQKNYIKAIGDFTSAISLSPDFADAYFERAHAKEMLANQEGFTSSEQCVDWIQALKLGKSEAAQKLLEACGNECITTSNINGAQAATVFCLDWSSQRLTRLPDQLKGLDNLLRLDVSNNALRTWDKQTTLSRNLVQLDISKNQLTQVPATMSDLTQLRELNLSYNRLSMLPGTIGQLQNVRELYLRNNALQTLPGQLADLTSLEYLDVSFNKLQSLPTGMEQLRNLKHLKLVGNPLDAAQQQAIRAQLPHCTIEFD